MNKEIPENIKKRLTGLHFTDPVCVLIELDLGDGYYVRVIGDPGNATYEWVIERAAGSFHPCKVQFSDCGYGQSEIALRDGLIAYYGPPTNLIAREGSAQLKLDQGIWEGAK